MLAVGRPYRFLIVVRAWIEEFQRRGSHFVHRDEAVISAVAYKGQVAPVRRPSQRTAFASRVDQLLRLFAAVQLREPNLILQNVRNRIALRRYRRRTPLADFAGFAAFHRSDPYVLLDARDKAGGIRVRRVEIFQISAANVHHRCSIGSPREIAHVLPVVLRVFGDGESLKTFAVGGRLGDPDIALSFVVENPRKPVPGRSCRQFAGKWRAQRLLNGKSMHCLARRCALWSGASRNARSHEQDCQTVHQGEACHVVVSPSRNEKRWYVRGPREARNRVIISARQIAFENVYIDEANGG